MTEGVLLDQFSQLLDRIAAELASVTDGEAVKPAAKSAVRIEFKTNHPKVRAKLQAHLGEADVPARPAGDAVRPAEQDAAPSEPARGCSPDAAEPREAENTAAQQKGLVERDANTDVSAGQAASPCASSEQANAPAPDSEIAAQQAQPEQSPEAPEVVTAAVSQPPPEQQPEAAELKTFVNDVSEHEPSTAETVAGEGETQQEAAPSEVADAGLPVEPEQTLDIPAQVKDMQPVGMKSAPEGGAEDAPVQGDGAPVEQAVPAGAAPVEEHPAGLAAAGPDGAPRAARLQEAAKHAASTPAMTESPAFAQYTRYISAQSAEAEAVAQNSFSALGFVQGREVSARDVTAISSHAGKGGVEGAGAKGLDQKAGGSNHHFFTGGESSFGRQSEVKADGPKPSARPLSRGQMMHNLEKVESALKEAARSKDGTTISLRLDPPNLGQVKVDVTLRDGHLHARLSAETPQVLTMLRERAQELQMILRKAGVDVEQVSVAVTSDGSSSTAFENSLGEQAQPDSHRGSPGGASQARGTVASTWDGVKSDAILDHWVA